MAWLKLIRWQNLIIIFLTQLFAWGCVIVPMQQYAETPLLLDWSNFLLISTSTVLIAAAGYIINDYFDIKIDSINKPEKMVLEKRIPMRLAIIAHSIINIIGILLALIVARRAGHYIWLILQLSCTILLVFYSTTFKRQFITGNLVVALLTAFTIVVLMVYETGMHFHLFKPYFIDTKNGLSPNPVWVLGIYAYFAFMLTWMREIVKDMEDFKGDKEQGCMTMPIKWGLLRSVRFTQALGLFTITPLILGALKLYHANWITLSIYTLLGLALPISIWIFFLNKKATTEHYHKASRWLKVIMVLGIGSLIIYYLQTYA
ncbi:MAG: geranylgeranylglycerol-phosphate geranylgeranyltransferase [Flavipsychrobacter sp.]